MRRANGRYLALLTSELNFHIFFFKIVQKFSFRPLNLIFSQYSVAMKRAPAFKPSTRFTSIKVEEPAIGKVNLLIFLPLKTVKHEFLDFRFFFVILIRIVLG
jgi:hypothetical protein